MIRIAISSLMLALILAATPASASDTAPLAASPAEALTDAPGQPDAPDQPDRTPQASAEQVRVVDDARPSAPADQAQQPAPPTPIAMGPILDGDALQLSFQALLKDNNGDPLAGPVDLTFNIYRIGGALIEGPINVPNVPVSNGVVNTTFPVLASSFDGNGRELGVSINGGAELAPHTPLVTVPYALRVDRVTSDELDDAIDLGDGSNYGALNVFRATATGGPSISLNGNANQISTYGDDGLEQFRVWGGAWGEIFLFDSSVTNDRTVLLSATSNSGGQLTLTDADGGSSVFANGGDGSVSAEQRVRVVSAIGGTEYASLGLNGGGGGVLRTYDETGTQTVILGSSASGGGAFGTFHMDSSIWGGVVIDGDDGNGGNIRLWKPTVTLTVDLDASETGTDGSQLTLYDAAGQSTVELDAQEGSGAALRLFDDTGTQTFVVDAQEGSAGGGAIYLYNGAGVNTVEIDAEETDSASAIRLKDASGITRITLDPAVTGGGRVITPVLQITGGSDLSENFDVTGDIRPGMVVSIDPQNEGRLIASHAAYDRRVAGVVSGAGGIQTGMLMGHEGTLADGAHPVALTGRVYCLADESNGPITPGDLLTTANKAGHCMKVTDHGQAQGAILGKAMGRVRDGMVLVLVNLQ